MNISADLTHGIRFILLAAPSSWADGRQVLVGESSVDFELALIAIEGDTARVIVRHVPPADPGIKSPASWMRVGTTNRPNNWIQVKKVDGAKLMLQQAKRLLT